jgi:hypothetical protein
MAFSFRWLGATTIFKDERLFMRQLSFLHDKNRDPPAGTESKV